MFNALFDSSTIPLLQKVAAFTERRQEVLAGNLANVSTPDYRSRDLPTEAFQEALRAAVAARTLPDQPASANWAFHDVAGQNRPAQVFRDELFQAVEAADPGPTFQDGNNRNIELLAMQVTKNSLMQSMAVQLMNAQFTRLQAVISERP